MSHRPDLIEWADDKLVPLGLIKKKTFSCPSWYKAGKLSVFVHEDTLVLKLKPERVAEFSKKNPEIYGVFTPMKKPMKNWLTILHPETVDYEFEWPLVEECLGLTR